ncbi:hypothetical protein [Lederbergia lenta]|uniref:hypothetical protein n=1 Tax=Lederbergia lenta TaxID=1467 RepID=UPI00203A7AA7|nr:hypothetical protein [Lederbergia lenta]MCM3111674.1 hypothetical protein [Lederbergia lenta]
MKINNLISCFEKAKETNAKFVGIAVRVPDAEEPEVIINGNKNIEAKLDYYKKTYDEDLSHKAVGDILQIIGFTYGNSFSDIEKELLEGGEGK